MRNVWRNFIKFVWCFSERWGVQKFGKDVATKQCLKLTSKCIIKIQLLATRHSFEPNRLKRISDVKLAPARRTTGYCKPWSLKSVVYLYCSISAQKSLLLGCGVASAHKNVLFLKAASIVILMTAVKCSLSSSGYIATSSFSIDVLEKWTFWSGIVEWFSETR